MAQYADHLPSSVGSSAPSMTGVRSAGYQSKGLWGLDPAQRGPVDICRSCRVDTTGGPSGEGSGDIVDRAALRRVQTPQAFAFDILLTAHRSWTGAEEPTDDAQMIRVLGHDVHLVEATRHLRKSHCGDHERMGAF